MLSGIILGWTARARERKKEVKDEAKCEAESDTAIKIDIQYIKRGIDDVRLELRYQNQQINGLSDRVTRVEESAKQAHKRIDRIEEIKGV
jgi:hypothetical protein